MFKWITAVLLSVAALFVAGFVFMAAMFTGTVVAAQSLVCGESEVYLPPLAVEVDWEQLEADLDEIDRVLRKNGSPVLLPEQREGIQTVVGVGAAWLLSQQGLKTALIAAASESLFDWTLTQEESDRDSLGLFQQRPSQGWGTVEEISDPVYATNAFLTGVVANGKRGLLDVENREELEIWQAAQEVQRSATPDGSNFRRWVEHADAIVDAVDFGDLGDGTEFTALGCFANENAAGTSKGMAAEMAAMGLSNGRLSAEWLVTVSPGCEVTVFGGAAEHWQELMAEASKDGVDLKGLYCYRTEAAQRDAWNRRQCGIPGNCDGNPYPPTAFPGTSNHGWGLAVDVGSSHGILNCSSPQLLWMQGNAPNEGWKWPEWAHCDKSSREAWHWEFEGAPSEHQPDTTTLPTQSESNA